MIFELEPACFSKVKPICAFLDQKLLECAFSDAAIVLSGFVNHKSRSLAFMLLQLEGYSGIYDVSRSMIRTIMICRCQPVLIGAEVPRSMQYPQAP